MYDIETPNNKPDPAFFCMLNHSRVMKLHIELYQELYLASNYS